MAYVAQGVIGPGDWICYLDHGRLTIGVVQYVRDSYTFGQRIVYTLEGSCREAEIMEVRSERKQ